jgi:hypothetical protein
MSENAIAQFTYLPATKAERETFVQMCVDEITSGTRNPLQLEIMLKNMEDTIAAIRKRQEVKDLVLQEAEKYSEKTFSFMGAKVTKVERSKYFFNECGDSVYNDLVTKKSSLDEKIKERETFLKTIKPGIEIADTETGEVIKPPTTATTTSLTITLP